MMPSMLLKTAVQSKASATFGSGKTAESFTNMMGKNWEKGSNRLFYSLNTVIRRYLKGQERNG
jgi:hypothetical protein